MGNLARVIALLICLGLVWSTSSTANAEQHLADASTTTAASNETGEIYEAAEIDSQDDCDCSGEHDTAPCKTMKCDSHGLFPLFKSNLFYSPGRYVAQACFVTEYRISPEPAPPRWFE